MTYFTKSTPYNKMPKMKLIKDKFCPRNNLNTSKYCKIFVSLKQASPSIIKLSKVWNVDDLDRSDPHFKKPCSKPFGKLFPIITRKNSKKLLWWLKTIDYSK